MQTDKIEIVMQHGYQFLWSSSLGLVNPKAKAVLYPECHRSEYEQSIMKDYYAMWPAWRGKIACMFDSSTAFSRHGAPHVMRIIFPSENPRSKVYGDISLLRCFHIVSLQANPSKHLQDERASYFTNMPKWRKQMKKYITWANIWVLREKQWTYI